ncbi:hypothetical protein V6N12_049808 [Hibiscus sabdariffa]
MYVACVVVDRRTSIMSYEVVLKHTNYGRLCFEEVAAQWAMLPFDVWLHGNISGTLTMVDAEVDWSMQFSIFCWLLWKLRCSVVLDARYVQRESVLEQELWAICDGLRHAWEVSFRRVVLETDNKEVASICNGLSSTLDRSALVSMIHDLLRRSWHVRVYQVCRERNSIADKLARMGRQHMQ